MCPAGAWHPARSATSSNPTTRGATNGPRSSRCRGKLSGYALAAFEGKLYLFGGWDGQNYHAEVWQYDPDLDKWTAKSPMQTARAFADAAVPERQGRIYVIGGENAERRAHGQRKLQPSRGRRLWAALEHQSAAAGTVIHHMAIATTGRTIFVIGGSNAEKQLLQYSVALEFVEARCAPDRAAARSAS